MKYLTADDVVAIHDDIIGSHELQGLAQNKSIDAIIARIETRLAYSMIADCYELAACYACYIAVGHAFNDANKRTAFTCMDLCLVLNGIELSYDTEEAGQTIIKASQGKLDEMDIAQWLRDLSQV